MGLRKLFLVCALLVSFGAQSQMKLYPNSSLRFIRNSVDSSAISLGSNLNAAAMVVSTNFAVWGFDRFITHSEFAYISPSTIRANFRKGFVWDNDFFNTNLFLHPYNGGLYFNAARSNGMNYWQSFPYSIGGSLMWELFMEKEYPSLNDLISTSIGGSGLGEVTFRLSDLIIDERSSGMERFGREAATFLVSPARGLTRLISGKSWKRERSRGNRLPLIPVNGYLKMGYRNLYNYSSNRDDVSSMPFLNIGFSYGNPYDEDNDRPYDYFSASAYLNLSSSQPIISRVKMIGMLYSDQLNFIKAKSKLTWGIYQHFNYFESTSDSNHVTLYPYKLSEAASIGPGFLFKKSFGKYNHFYASAFLSGILLGSSQSDHYKVYNRDYNLGSGFSTKLDLEWLLKERLSIRLKSEDYRIYTWLGADPTLNTGSTQGDRSNASLSVLALNMNYRINKHLFLGLESSFFYRSTVYQHFPTVEHGVVDSNISLGWLF